MTGRKNPTFFHRKSAVNMQLKTIEIRFITNESFESIRIFPQTIKKKKN